MRFNNIKTHLGMSKCTIFISNQLINQSVRVLSQFIFQELD